MLFFFKEKPIEIVAFTSEEYLTINVQSPIKPAREYFPDWWKNTPSSKFNWDTFNVNSTTKSCPGIGQTLQKGFILPLWSDLAIKTQGNQYQWQYADRISKFEIHSNDQAPGFYEDYYIFKINSPWQIKSPVSLIYTFPFYLFPAPLPYLTPTGIVTPVNKMCATNIFILLKRIQEEICFMIKQGTPLFHIIPLTEKKVVFRTEVISKAEYFKLKRDTAYKKNFTANGLKNIVDKKT